MLQQHVVPVSATQPTRWCGYPDRGRHPTQHLHNPCRVARSSLPTFHRECKDVGPKASAFGQPKVFQDILDAMMRMGRTEVGGGSHLYADKISYHPAGAARPLLKDATMHLAANELGLVYGSSGSGKTTLLQVLSGLCEATSGSMWIAKTQLLQNGGPENNGAGFPTPLPGNLPASQRLEKVGMVFQFPERHFLGNSIRSELTFGWPPSPMEFQELLLRVQWALGAVGMMDIPVDTPTTQLSDGYKRRLALSVQLVRQPEVLVLDEPLAGLDWKARRDMVTLLGDLKEKCTLLVVSHDLREISALADSAWEMVEGGQLRPTPVPKL